MTGQGEGAKYRGRSLEVELVLQYSRMLGLGTLLGLGMVTACAARSPEGAPLPLVAVADVPLGGATTRMDYASLDSARHLLFVAHLGDSAVIVFDTQTRRVVARIPDIRHVHGVLVVPELHRVYATATGSNEVVAIDEETLKVVARAPAGVYPDGMAYAPAVRKLYVSDEHGATETVIDAVTNQRVATLPLGGEVGNTQYDPVSQHIFVNVQGRRQLVEIDPTHDTVVDRIDLPGAQGNHGLQIVPKARWAIIACEDNHRMLVVDLAQRRVLQSFDVGDDPDVLAYDPGLGWLYVASESGTVSVFTIGPHDVSKRGESRLAPNAHVVAVDATTHLAYFPLSDLDHHTALRIMRPAP